MKPKHKVGVRESEWQPHLLLPAGDGTQLLCHGRMICRARATVLLSESGVSLSKTAWTHKTQPLLFLPKQILPTATESRLQAHERRRQGVHLRRLDALKRAHVQIHGFREHFLCDAALFAHPFQVAGEGDKFRDLQVSAQRGALCRFSPLTNTVQCTMLRELVSKLKCLHCNLEIICFYCHFI